MSEHSRITIVGSGFGALAALHELRARDAQAEITVVSPRAELHYLPGIIWIPSGLRSREQLVVPLRNYFGRQRVRHVEASATGLDASARVLHTTAGDIENDALLVASGGQFIHRLPGIEHAIIPCEGISAAERIRDRLREMPGGTIAIGFGGNPAEPTAMRGGPMFEFLFGIERQLRREGRRDRFQLVFFNPSHEPGKRLGTKTVAHLLREMRRRGIVTRLGEKPQRFEADRIVTDTGEIPAQMILFMPGMTGNAWLDATALPRSPGGLLSADMQCRVIGQEHVYVAGDCGSFPAPDWMPKQAHMAELQGRAAARNLLDALAGRPVQASFEPELMCIIDALDTGTLVWRTERRRLMLPSARTMHWAKRFFEKLYLAKYR